MLVFHPFIHIWRFYRNSNNTINIIWIFNIFIQILTDIVGYLTFGVANCIHYITFAMIEHAGNHILTVILILLLIMNVYFYIPIGVILSTTILVFYYCIIAWLLITDIAILSAIIDDNIDCVSIIVSIDEQKCKQWLCDNISCGIVLSGCYFRDSQRIEKKKWIWYYSFICNELTMKYCFRSNMHQFCDLILNVRLSVWARER